MDKRWKQIYLNEVFDYSPDTLCRRYKKANAYSPSNTEIAPIGKFAVVELQTADKLEIEVKTNV
jgi:hypothetical protein